MASDQDLDVARRLGDPMVRFETICHHETEYGERNFLEVSRKLARDESKPDDLGVEFISISRGYRMPNGDRRFRMHFTMPPEPELIDFIKSSLCRVVE